MLAAAMRLRCEALVTGDRTHFGALYGKTINGVSIHSPRSLAEAGGSVTIAVSPNDRFRVAVATPITGENA